MFLCWTVTFTLLTLNVESHRGRHGCLLSPDNAVVTPSILPPGLEDCIFHRSSISEPDQRSWWGAAGHTGQVDLTSLSHRAGLHNSFQLWGQRRSSVLKKLKALNSWEHRLFFVFTFYSQLSWSSSPQLAEYCRNSNKVKPLVTDLYILDLQVTVAPVVALIYKMFGVVRRRPDFPLVFWPADRIDNVQWRNWILALHHDGCPFQSALVFQGHVPNSTLDTFGPKYT